MRSLFLVPEIHWHSNPIVLIIDFSSFIHFAAAAQLKAGNGESRRRPEISDLGSRLTCV